MFAILQTAGFTTTEWLLDWLTPPPPSGSATPVGTLTTPSPDPASSLSITDHRTWVDIGGIRVPKRLLLEFVQ